MAAGWKSALLGQEHTLLSVSLASRHPPVDHCEVRARGVGPAPATSTASCVSSQVQPSTRPLPLGSVTLDAVTGVDFRANVFSISSFTAIFEPTGEKHAYMHKRLYLRKKQINGEGGRRKEKQESWKEEKRRHGGRKEGKKAKERKEELIFIEYFSH